MKLTVFTPTYNRAHTLERLFDSLKGQTDMRFEWLLVDDGSTDGTEELIQTFQDGEPGFTIRYYRQDHGGKPRAQNWAVDLAEGEYFITCDSNKFLSSNAVERILQMFDSIRGLSQMCGVGGYRADITGKIFGGEMDLGAMEFVDCTILEQSRYKISGDKASAFYTDILRRYKSPEYPGETFVSEGVWLLPIAMDGYRTRWFPEVLIYGEYASDGLTAQGANSYSGHVKNFLGYLHYVSIEIRARGIDAVLVMVHEALDIAEEKGMLEDELANRLGCSTEQIRRVKANRRFHRVYGKMTKIVKSILGDKIVDRIRKLLGR